MDIFVRILDIQPLLNSGAAFSDIGTEVLSKCQKIKFKSVFESASTQQGQNASKAKEKKGFCSTCVNITSDFSDISDFSPTSLPVFFKTEENTSENIGFVVDRLSDFYKNYVLSAKNFKNSVERLGTSLLIYDFFNERFGISPPALYKNENGKPYFADIPLGLSVSHTDGLAVCAFAESEDAPVSLGIDAEALPSAEKYHSLRRIAERFFVGAEELIGLSENEFCDAFTLLWTKKESLVKMTGEGIGSIKKAQALDCYGVSYKLFRDSGKRKYYISLSCMHS